jgi:GT2 family glycosyltransferase
MKKSSVYIPIAIQNAANVDAEFFIWDNGSKDGTVAWLQKLESKHSNVRVLYSDKNSGTEAINFIAKEAKGKYLLKLDDDVRVPNNYISNLIGAYEKCPDRRLLYLAYDMQWGAQTFGMRNGIGQYSGDSGEVFPLSTTESILISKKPGSWMVNGACRLCEAKNFWLAGGHPKIQYGEDNWVSEAAEKIGFTVGFYHNKHSVILHDGTPDEPSYRKFKDKWLIDIGEW